MRAAKLLAVAAAVALLAGFLLMLLTALAEPGAPAITGPARPATAAPG